VSLDLSIIIANWNTAALLKNCLASIPSAVEVIVVDNASTDDSVTMVAHDFPRVRLIRNSENAGFARANNQGWRASAHEFVLFLNSDTLVPPDALRQLVEFMRVHSDAGVCGPRLARADNSTQPFAFGGDPTPAYLLRRGFARLILHRTLHDWETREPQSVDWVSGACSLVRHAALERVGGWDEKFFMYFEDNELCLRLRRAGWKIFYNPHVTITHLGGASLVQNKTRTQFYDASLRYFYAKHYPPLARAVLELMLPFYRRMI
jgi:N-acetylglucosaminyl-diphospho-decaprenol L-rhamnosyltransferase